MSKNEDKFVYVKKDIYAEGLVVLKNEIGIVDSIIENNYYIQFITTDKIIKLSQNEFDFFHPQETGDAFPKKVCNVCNRLLSTEEFSKNQNGKNNRSVRRPSCNQCRKVIDGVNLSSKNKKKWEESRPNLEPFTCPICGKKTIPGLTSKIVIDHDHNTGKPRAWICDSCNTGLGRFKDDVNLLKNAITYLETM